MSGAYPHFKPCYTHEELVEHFLLTPADLQLVLTCRGDANRCGMALSQRSWIACPAKFAHSLPDNWVYFGTSASDIRGIAERGISIELAELARAISRRDAVR